MHAQATGNNYKKILYFSRIHANMSCALYNELA